MYSLHTFLIPSDELMDQDSEYNGPDDDAEDGNFDSSSHDTIKEREHSSSLSENRSPLAAEKTAWLATERRVDKAGASMCMKRTGCGAPCSVPKRPVAVDRLRLHLFLYSVYSFMWLFMPPSILIYVVFRATLHECLSVSRLIFRSSQAEGFLSYFFK